MKNSRIRKILIATSEKRRNKKPGEEKFLDATPIGDLSFLLFIFFMVTGSFVLREGILFSLPAKYGKPVHVEEQNIIDVFPCEKGFIMGGQILNRSQLLGELKNLKSRSGEKILLIHMAPETRYDRLVDTLSVARESEIRRVSLQQSGRYHP